MPITPKLPTGGFIPGPKANLRSTRDALPDRKEFSPLPTLWKTFRGTRMQHVRVVVMQKI